MFVTFSTVSTSVERELITEKLIEPRPAIETERTLLLIYNSAQPDHGDSTQAFSYGIGNLLTILVVRHFIMIYIMFAHPSKQFLGTLVVCAQNFKSEKVYVVKIRTNYT